MQKCSGSRYTAQTSSRARSTMRYISRTYRARSSWKSTGSTSASYWTPSSSQPRVPPSQHRRLSRSLVRQLSARTPSAHPNRCTRRRPRLCAHAHLPHHRPHPRAAARPHRLCPTSLRSSSPRPFPHLCRQGGHRRRCACARPSPHRRRVLRARRRSGARRRRMTDPAG